MKRNRYIGIDVGGTNMRLGLVNPAGGLEAVRKSETEIHRGADQACQRIIEACRSFMKEAEQAGTPVAGIGMGVPGKIDPVAGKVIFSPNLQEMNDYSLAPRVEEALGIPVQMENDANVFGLGEDWVGSGRDVENWVGLTLGTGVGGCLLFGGKLWTGDNLGFVGEIGHVIISPGGPRCNCGSFGCLEAIASGTGLKKGVRRAVEDGRLTEGPLFDAYRAGDLEPLTIYRAADLGSSLAAELFETMGWALGLAIGNVFTLLGIRHAVIGGGVSAAWERFFPSLMKTLEDSFSMVDASNAVILRSRLEDDAALLGAARLVL
jgi:glucokinase